MILLFADKQLAATENICKRSSAHAFFENKLIQCPPRQRHFFMKSHKRVEGKDEDSDFGRWLAAASGDPQRPLLAYRNVLIHSRSRKVLVEEAIPYGYPNLIGRDVMVREEEIQFLGLMDCIREEQDGLVPCRKIWPSRAPQGIRRKITETLQQMPQKLQIWDAELNVEFIAGQDGKIYPIEIALRCGGNGIPQLLSDITGVD